MKSINIDILLATYNGEKYIGQLIDSILAQTYQNWKLIIRDDGSNDNTIDIIGNHVKQYPDKIHLIDNPQHNIGVIKNFETLLNSSTSDYIMFADQDDVWFPSKVEKTISKMLKVEKTNSNLPILVHTDMKVVNENLQTVSDSFFKFQNLNPKVKSINRLLVQNNVTGCTVMINKRLKELALPFPPNILMHDWYLALLASSKGVIDFIPEQTVLYRQHSFNRLGAVEYGKRYIVNKIFTLFSSKSLLNTQEQAKALSNDSEIAKVYSNLRSNNWFKRRYLVMKYGFFKTGLLRNIGLLCSI